jgi:hypothetical protein
MRRQSIPLRREEVLRVPHLSHFERWVYFSSFMLDCGIRTRRREVAQRCMTTSCPLGRRILVSQISLVPSFVGLPVMVI